MKPFAQQTYYELLEVPVTAPMEEIRAAYSRLMELYAPDSIAVYALVEPDQVDALRARMTEAMEILTDGDLRGEYDRDLGLPAPWGTVKAAEALASAVAEGKKKRASEDEAPALSGPEAFRASFVSGYSLSYVTSSLQTAPLVGGLVDVPASLSVGAEAQAPAAEPGPVSSSSKAVGAMEQGGASVESAPVAAPGVAQSVGSAPVPAAPSAPVAPIPTESSPSAASVPVASVSTGGSSSVPAPVASAPAVVAPPVESVPVAAPPVAFSSPVSSAPVGDVPPVEAAPVVAPVASAPAVVAPQVGATPVASAPVAVTPPAEPAPVVAAPAVVAPQVEATPVASAPVVVAPQVETTPVASAPAVVAPQVEANPVASAPAVVAPPVESTPPVASAPAVVAPQVESTPPVASAPAVVAPQVDATPPVASAPAVVAPQVDATPAASAPEPSPAHVATVSPAPAPVAVAASPDVPASVPTQPSEPGTSIVVAGTPARAPEPAPPPVTRPVGPTAPPPVAPSQNRVQTGRQLSEAQVLAQDSAIATAEAALAQVAARTREPRPRLPDIPADAEFNGELLRRVRETRGYTLQQVADRTRISSRHLENVEADRYTALPAQVYLRGILMNLARELGLDPLRVSRSYLALASEKSGKK
ncbi:helix-turn-helix domain-containing protein [Myxococcus sp. XM-1-1-1]|uniref:helix-turn-helix domain-containing protein n=1 Tax=Myxococcus sp. XM-1-1-1 TaxID=2874602 RepID=UPI001CC12D71|nr:helix-turn-helix domain-containing protein [Myxococcus sp. XM-1-1-1]MBZ4409080.1 helix-turn-helix domain-containing protein [Myxococcus sp. XM-1-1-1]